MAKTRPKAAPGVQRHRTAGLQLIELVVSTQSSHSKAGKADAKRQASAARFIASAACYC